MVLLKFFSTARKIQSYAREVKKSHTRSPLWSDVRDMYIGENPACAGCGSIKSLQVHHIVPFHVAPSLELVTENLITLCMDLHDCHLRLGHGGSFACYNPNVESDCVSFLKASENERKLIHAAVKQNRLKD